MDNKKFIIFRYIVIVLTCLGLIGIEIYKNNTSSILEENDAIKAAKEYVNNNSTYFNEMFKEKDMEIRINTDILVKDKLLKM